jgi:hypothetical protein
VGETKKRPFQLSFNSSLKIDFQGSRVTSDGGLVLVRELDERLGFGELVDRHLSDSRRGKNIQLPLADLLRQSIYSRLAGYEDVNDAARLSQDPTFRLIGSRKIWERGAALTSRLQSFETEVLTPEKNLVGLAALNRELVARAEAIYRFASARRAGYGQHGDPGLRRTKAKCVQRPLRVHLLPSAAAVQSRRRLPSGQAPAWQRPQCQRLGGTAAAGD